MIGFPALSFAFTFWLPAAVQVSFMATGILSYFQMEIFRNEKLRERLGMYPLEARRPPGASSSPYQGAINIKPRPAALTQAELNQTYAEPSAQFKAGQQPLRDMSPPGILGGAIKDIKGTFSSAKEGVSEARKMATEQFEGRKKKAERDSVLAYEKKRQKEVAAAEREMERQRRAIRASKKAKRS
jgi:YidC/Oxa1 family membrane protein insertase